MPTYQYTRSGSTFDSATPRKALNRYELVNFFEIIQTLGIDLIPISSEPGLGSIGQGATADIREAIFNLRSSLALKRRKFEISSGMEEIEIQILPSLVAEISILNQVSRLKFANIVRLEGMCLEVLFEEGHVFS